ncbi:MAG: glycosyltransferase, partial [Planctomycetia bacterium]|nr:glycosyltransferase [Planctomycetia bacterium]
MKYLEIAASRTLVAGDLPDTARPVFAGGCVELHLGQSDEEILAALRGHLADKERLRALTDTVHRRVLAECSTDAFADRLLAHLRERLAEWRSTRRPRSLPPAVPVRGAMPSPGTPPAVRAAPEFGAATAGSAALPENRGALTDPFQVAAAPAGGLLLARPRPQLSLCMIVRDSARTLGACLQSIRPWVDEMIVVDTGSRDHTPELAARLGARVVHFPWPDSFAIARNESLRHARGRWVFWMDSDDTIDAANGRQLRELSARSSDP